MRDQNIYWYQSIPDLGIKGRMNTPEEFEKIGLPEDLKNKAVLDIGCNIGAFLLEASKRGATTVFGVEPLQEWRWLAKGLLDEHSTSMFKTVVSDTKEIKEGNFDLVLLLSVLHVTKNPQELLDEAWELLIDGGLLIVEINDRLQVQEMKWPAEAQFFGFNKDFRSIYHIWKK